MKGKVFAIIVAYNPVDGEIKKSIESALQQCDFCVVCNNSLSTLVYEHTCVHIFNFMENLGIASAQTIGMRWAYGNGADFTLQLDQDSEIPKNFVNQLLYTYTRASELNLNVGLVGPQDFDKITGRINKARLRQGIPTSLEGVYEVETTLSSGSLISKKAFHVLYSMYDDFFIDLVDHEFCWRLKQHGFIVLRDSNILMGHRLGEGRKNIMGIFSVGVPAAQRQYYSFRNSIFCYRFSYVPMHWKIFTLPKLFFKFFLYPFILPNGFDRFKYMSKGFYDGFIGRLGPYDRRQ